MTRHTVVRGECLSVIAARHGFTWQTLWEHPDNAALKELRQDPNVLYPGDVVVIPDPGQKQVPAPTTKRHRFRLEGTPAKFRLRLLWGRQARAALDYTLEIDGETFSGQTDGDGWLEHAVQPAARRGRLELTEEGEVYELELGHLDPVEENEGVQQRLRNLGIYRGEVNGRVDEATRQAIAFFQRSRELEVTGEVDDATREALREAHAS